MLIKNKETGFVWEVNGELASRYGRQKDKFEIVKATPEEKKQAEANISPVMENKLNSILNDTDKKKVTKTARKNG